MNQYHGSHHLGKRRLAELTKTEKEAARNPILGRSRAERMLDDSLISLKKARHEQIDPLTGEQLVRTHRQAEKIDLHNPSILEEDDKGRLRLNVAAVSEPKKDPLTKNAPRLAEAKPRPQRTSDPAYLDLLNVVRWLERRDKFARAIQLIHRCFTLREDGKRMLQAWRRVVNIEPTSDDVSSVILDALDTRAWVIFYAAWKVATSSHVANNGDARELILRLFDTVWVKEDEDSVTVATAPQFKNRDGVPRDFMSLVSEQDIDEFLAKESRPAVEIHCTIEGCALMTGSEMAGFFIEPWHWSWMFTHLMPVCRTSALYHNLLFTDDPHIFHRGLHALGTVLESIPANYRQHRDALAVAERPEEDLVDVKRIDWEVPNSGI